MIFSTRRLSTESDIKINNVSIERKREARFLGVIVDEKLNWGKHISAIRSKICRYIGAMYKIKTATLIDSLFSQQKKGIRAVFPGFINYRFKDGETPGKGGF